jgi:hypothetical protein
MNNRLKVKEKILIIIIVCLVLMISFLFTSEECFAADPALISKLKTAFEKIEGYIIKLATPVAAVAICSGALMKKFSFGDEEKIRTGRNLIKGSIFSYVLVLCTDMILSLINTLVG